MTREDIDGGRRRDPNDCAVARALRRLGVAHSGVTGMLVFLDNNRQRTSVLLPGRVQEWIVDFDWGAAVEPIEFELALPEQEPSDAMVSVRGSQPAGKPEPRRTLNLSGTSRLWRRNCPKAKTEAEPELELVA